jgi:hypothetical protein
MGEMLDFSDQEFFGKIMINMLRVIMEKSRKNVRIYR